MKGKSKIIKGILIIFLIALMGAGASAIASQKLKMVDTKNNETIQDKEDNEIENKEIDNEENVEQEPPIDNKLQRGSKRKRRLCNKWSKTKNDKRRSRKTNRQSRKIQ